MIKMSKAAKSEFSERIKDLRRQKSLSASAFAKLANVTPASVWQWENNGTSPRSETLTAIADTLGVTKDFLLFGRRHDDRVVKSGVPPIAPVTGFKEASLEDLIRGIEAKGFVVTIRSRG
jgi:transcriptional regulator with XRE-family HTH domain